MADTVEKLITNSIHTAFIKCPEGDGDANLDYDWISSEQSARITKAILLDLAANGFEIVKEGRGLAGFPLFKALTASRSARQQL
jgi:hypothetical protein